jgi:hypothetical protein
MGSALTGGLMEYALQSSLPSRDLNNCLVQALDALDVMKQFLDTRRVAALNQAWLSLSPAMAGLRSACGDLKLDATDAVGNLNCAFDTTDLVLLTDPDE